jgi:uncharacterized damage-inducible protein DinB
MNEILSDAFAHNAWATHTLLAYCRGLSAEQLQATAPGAVGTLIETLDHILCSEGRYRVALTGAGPRWNEQTDPTSDLDTLELRARDNERFWPGHLPQETDPDRVIRQVLGDGGVRETRAGVVIVQALQHATEHRGQACTIITALGLRPPDLQAWAYAVAVGRASWRRPEQDADASAIRP